MLLAVLWVAPDQAQICWVVKNSALPCLWTLVPSSEDSTANKTWQFNNLNVIDGQLSTNNKSRLAILPSTNLIINDRTPVFHSTLSSYNNLLCFKYIYIYIYIYLDWILKCNICNIATPLVQKADNISWWYLRCQVLVYHSCPNTL